MTVSDKQLKANKENSKSWGVKTQEGKQIVANNAIKHWLTSSRIVNEEEKELYDLIMEGLVEELKPNWLLEMMYVERIALYYMKLQRVAQIDTKQVVYEKMKTEKDYLSYICPAEPGMVEMDFDFMQREEESEDRRKLRLKLQSEISDITKKQYILFKSNISEEAIDIFDRLQKYETSIENRLYKSIREYYKIKQIRE